MGADLLRSFAPSVFYGRALMLVCLAAVAGAGCCVPPSPAPPLGRCFSWYCDAHASFFGAICTLSKLGYQNAFFPLHPLSFRNFFVPLQCFRIVGNGEDRPMNVKADAQANSGDDGFFLITAFLFRLRHYVDFLVIT